MSLKNTTYFKQVKKNVNVSSFKIVSLLIRANQCNFSSTGTW